MNLFQIHMNGRLGLFDYFDDPVGISFLLPASLILQGASGNVVVVTIARTYYCLKNSQIRGQSRLHDLL